MAIELKDALAAWKKAKPILLTKTGISEALRELPNPTKIDLKTDGAALEKVKKVLEVGVANKHIIAHKKAVECLKLILVTVNAEIPKYKKRRGDINVALKSIFDAGHAFLKAPSQANKGKIEAGLVSYNKLSLNLALSTPYFQVPPRVGLLAVAYLAAQPKGGAQFEGAKKEMEAYMKAHPMLAL